MQSRTDRNSGEKKVPQEAWERARQEPRQQGVETAYERTVGSTDPPPQKLSTLAKETDEEQNERITIIEREREKKLIQELEDAIYKLSLRT